jgi:hypothetical protein
MSLGQAQFGRLLDSLSTCWSAARSTSAHVRLGAGAQQELLASACCYSESVGESKPVVCPVLVLGSQSLIRSRNRASRVSVGKRVCRYAKRELSRSS